MGNAILLAVTGDTEIEIGIADFGRSAYGATMQRLGFVALGAFESLPPRRDASPVTRLVD